MSLIDSIALAAARLLAPAIRSIDTRLRAVEKNIINLEERMTSVEEQYAGEVGALVAVVVAEVLSLREGVRQKDEALALAQTALADADARTQQAVADALAADSAADAERLKVYLDQLKATVPVEVPEVAVPDPGVPAEPPADSGVEIPEVDSGSTDSGSPVS